MAQITLNSSGVASNGSLVLQSNGTTTAVTIDSSQRAAFVAGTAAAPAITTSGDTNTGIFFPAADTVGISTGGTERARVDSSGNVGIGTSSPSEKLHVNSGTGNVPALFESTDPIAVVQFKDNNSTGTNAVGVQTNSLIFYSNSNINMRLDENGNLGLGVTPSAWTAGKALQVGTSAAVWGLTRSVAITSNSYYDSADKYLTTGAAGQYVITSAGGHNWYTAASGTAGNTITFTQAMTLDASGNLGIGISSPGAKLDISVAGTASYSSSAAPTPNVKIQTDGSGNSRYTSLSIGSRGSSGQGQANYITSVPTSDSDSALAFSTYGSYAAAERMRIDGSGNLLVGTTSAGGKITSTTASQTAVYAQTTAGTNATIYSYVGYASSTATPALRCVKYDNNSTTSQVFVQFAINQDGANSGQINANGASAAAFGSYSDARLKENIVDLPSQLGNIMALRPVEFDYIGVEDGHQIGFIAQEMQQVYPDAVSVGNDEMLMITAWSKTEARLVKAIQEQQQIITQLQADVAALKGQA